MITKVKKHIVLDKDLMDRLTRKAEEEDRSVSNYINKVLKHHAMRLKDREVA